MRLPQVLKLAALVVCWTAASASHATSASAEIRNLRFTLYDLDPTDGIAPSMTFVAASGGAGLMSMILVDSIDYLGNHEDTHDHTESQMFAPLSAGAELHGNKSNASLVSDGLRAVGKSSGIEGHFAAEARTQTDFGNASAGLLLSPNTRLVVTGEVSLSATARDLCSNLLVGCESATASVLLELVGPDGGGGTGQQTSLSTRDISLSAHANDNQLMEDQYGGVMGVSFANFNSSPLMIDFAAYTSVSGDSISAVPEPASLALMVAGLVALGARRRVRKPALR